MDHAGFGRDTVVVGHSLDRAVALTQGGHAGRARSIAMLGSAVFPPDKPSPFDPTKVPHRPMAICTGRRESKTALATRSTDDCLRQEL